MNMINKEGGYSPKENSDNFDEDRIEEIIEDSAEKEKKENGFEEMEDNLGKTLSLLAQEFYAEDFTFKDVEESFNNLCEENRSKEDFEIIPDYLQKLVLEGFLEVVKDDDDNEGEDKEVYRLTDEGKNCLERK